MAQDSESRSLDKIVVRLPDGMRTRIAATARANNRSMNAEIVATLEDKYPAPIEDDEYLLLNFYRNTICHFKNGDDKHDKFVSEFVLQRIFDVIDGHQRVDGGTFKKFIERDLHESETYQSLLKRSAER